MTQPRSSLNTQMIKDVVECFLWQEEIAFVLRNIFSPSCSLETTVLGSGGSDSNADTR
jgi:hypothetical protein